MFDTEFTSTNAVFQSEFAAENEAAFKTEFVGGSGKDGASAYEIAVANGFVGTEEEWLESLKGADGYTPKKGVDYFDGAKGDTGADGKDGASAYEVWLEQGNKGTEQAFLNSLKGADGKDGKDGINGKDGADGKDGVKGEAGHTPIKGVDYFTEADKQEIVESVLASLPVYDGEVIEE